MSSEEKEDKPIPGPPSCPGPEHPFEPDWNRPKTGLLIFGRFLADTVRKPAHWIRENIVLPNRGEKYYWYHKKYEKALPIDECFTDDFVCIYEADIEYKRNRQVDRAILDLLQYRYDNCNFWNKTTRDQEYVSENCDDIALSIEREELNYKIKYGDLPNKGTVLQAFNKQKHRMIMERRIALKKMQDRGWTES